MSAREVRPYAVYGFPTTHMALAAERLLLDLGVPVTPIPAPKGLGGGVCGIALRIDPFDADRAEKLLERAGMTPNARGEIEDF